MCPSSQHYLWQSNSCSRQTHHDHSALTIGPAPRLPKKQGSRCCPLSACSHDCTPGPRRQGTCRQLAGPMRWPLQAHADNHIYHALMMHLVMCEFRLLLHVYKCIHSFAAPVHTCMPGPAMLQPESESFRKGASKCLERTCAHSYVRGCPISDTLTKNRAHGRGCYAAAHMYQRSHHWSAVLECHHPYICTGVWIVHSVRCHITTIVSVAITDAYYTAVWSLRLRAVGCMQANIKQHRCGICCPYAIPSEGVRCCEVRAPVCRQEGKLAVAGDADVVEVWVVSC